MKRTKNKPLVCCPIVPAPKTLTASPKHVAAFKGLAHVGRLRLFFHLVQSDKPLPANKLQSALGIPAPTLSHHLEHLEDAGLIERTKHQRFVFTIVRREMVGELVRLLTACC